MKRLHARVLLDTGPTESESAHIKGLFAEVGMSAAAEGHSYGGPPPTSAFLVVVNVSLTAFLDTFLARGAPGPDALGQLLRELLQLRADPRQWGRPHNLKLEDAHSRLAILIPPDPSAASLGALLQLDLAGFDRWSPTVTVVWNTSTCRWQGRLRTHPNPLLRRLPERRDLLPVPSVGQLAAAETRELWRLAEGGAASVVQWQRAQVVLLSSLGWGAATIASATLLTTQRVREVVGNFIHDGLASLLPSYTGGAPAQPAPEAERDARAAVAAGPTTFGLARRQWDQESLTELLVGQGILEDVDPLWLAATLSDVGVTASSRKVQPCG